MSRRKEVIYSDIRGDLSLNPATDDVLLVTNEDAIRTSIINLLNTDRYERVMQPNLGSNIRALLFENADVQIFCERSLNGAKPETSEMDNFDTFVIGIHLRRRVFTAEHGVTKASQNRQKAQASKVR